MPQKAYDLWKLLGGVVCAYKPPDTSYKYVLTKLKNVLCRDLNNLETRPPRKCLIADRSNGEISISIRPSYADNVLCAGPRYQHFNIRAEEVKPLSDISSGVFLVCLNGGRFFSRLFKQLNFTRCYHVKGVLGQATTNFHTTGKVLARANYEKVDKNRFERVLASFQSALQTRVFEEHGIPFNSQEAYNFAVNGLYRPVRNGPTILYVLRLVELKPPDFTLEVQCINETDVYLMNMIHNLGVRLKSYATCVGIRCLRHGCFHVEHSLAKNQWDLNNVIDNIKLTWEILEKTYPNKIKFTPAVGKDNSYTSLEL